VLIEETFGDTSSVSLLKRRTRRLASGRTGGSVFFRSSLKTAFTITVQKNENP